MAGDPILPLVEAGGHEAVLLSAEPAAGYRGIIAIHSTVLGPAAGGTRVWPYATEAEAIVDALRLSRGMTLKNAMAGIPMGGGKSVIIADARTIDREAVFRAHGRAIHRLGGRYITGEDVGTTVADMEFIAAETPHVAGRGGGAGDPSPYTARGVFRAMQAGAQAVWGSPDLGGRTVALQGCGNVGAHLARLLADAGAQLTVCDLDAARAARVADETGARFVPVEAIYDAPTDIFTPCAMGQVLNEDTIPRLKGRLVTGGANNQLRSPRDGDALLARGITYVPDYVANAGGVLSGASDVLGWPLDRVKQKIEAIYDTALEVLGTAKVEGLPPSEVADRIAWRRIDAARTV